MAFQNIYGAEASVGVDDGELDVIDEDCLKLLQALLPPGIAWTREPNTELTSLLRALSYEFCRLKRRGTDLLDELDPDSTREMLEDWERNYALPGDCVVPTTLAGRRTALHALMLGFTDPTDANFIAIATELGYDVTIEEFKRADIMTCESECDDTLLSDQWMFVWDVFYYPTDENDAIMQCSIEAGSPLHTVVRFYMRLDWIQRTSGKTIHLRGVTDHAGLWVVVGDAVGGAKGTVLTSSDGITWTARTSATANDLDFYAVASNGTTLVAVGEDGVINTSTNGTAWTSRTSPFGAGDHLYGVAWNTSIGLFVAVGAGGILATSPTGVTWTSRVSGVVKELYSVAGGGAYFVVAGAESCILTSTNGTAWTARTGATIANLDTDFFGVGYGNGYFTAVGSFGNMITVLTNPTTTWTRIRSPQFGLSSADFPEDALTSVCIGAPPADTGLDALWVTVGGKLDGARGVIKDSIETDAFRDLDSGSMGQLLLGVAQRQDGSTHWVAVGETGTILTAGF